MKKIGSAVLPSLLFMSMALFLQAQSLPTIIAPTETVEPYTYYKANIKVANFKNIVGVQFTMNWDSTILKYREIEEFIYSNNTTIESFGETKTSAGILTFQWVDSGLRGNDLNDSTTLFSIEFEVIGHSNSFSPFLFTDDIAIRQVADTSYNAIPARFENGMISVQGATGVTIYNNAPHKIQVKNSYPNPFHDFTQIQFELKESTKARLVILNMQGQTVYEAQRVFTSGENTLTLTKDMFPSPGSYQYSLIGTDFTVTQKLIFF